MRNLERIDNAIRMLDEDIAGLTSACHVADAATTESHLRRLEAERASLIYERMETQSAAKQLFDEYGETDDNVDDFAAFDTDDFPIPDEGRPPEVSPAAHICNMWHGAVYEFLEKAGFFEFVYTMTCKLFTSADTEEKYNIARDVGTVLIYRWQNNEDRWCDEKQDSTDAIIYLTLLDAWRVYCKQDMKQRGIEGDDNNEKEG